MNSQLMRIIENERIAIQVEEMDAKVCGSDPKIFPSLDKSAGFVPELAESQRPGVRYEL
jgi:hypothetical protein